MQKDHELLSENYGLLEQSIINADDSTPIDNFGANAYLFYRATNSVDNVKLITLRSPMTTLKNRYHFREGAFHPIENKVLNLYSYIDLIVVDNTIYFMSMNGENLFNMERAYKKICNAHVELICTKSIVSDRDRFADIATHGHNPRTFVSYDEERLEYILDIGNRQRISDKFGISLTMDKLIDVDDKNNAVRFVKYLCGKGLIDPINDVPREVSGSRDWT